ncbi:helix-turn-helix domain-containing protein [Flammeovirga sp. MY04]|uniref:helix-turn-helix domain-containing protein n=1 Tax=Flammeovirga sp. MY04 TaxID=1191459 RepID=UPI0008061B54|nr:helix-turn-helix domain-containing protein [Flammeovirga sp. MY04]ANQ49776.1 helix-turn-helix domain-containing protein [Flammeovirga sp. MY04]
MSIFTSFGTTKRTIFLSTLLLIFGVSAYSSDHITITIKHLPDYTPKETEIFLVTSYNNWNPRDENFQLKKNSQGEFFITLPKRDKPFQYKFTRGTWLQVEGNDIGEIKQNRWYDPKGPEQIDVVIMSWQDMAKKYLNRVKIIVNETPDETPYDATLFIAGDFNNWNPRDPESKMSKHPDGKYYLSLPLGLKKFQYKITRGSWESVEGRDNGRAIHNRKYDIDVDGWKTEIKVNSWEDLSGNTMTPYMFLLLLGAFQGLLLILSIFGIQENNRKANVVLITLILLTSIAIICRVGTFYRDIFNAAPKLYLFPEMLLFLYGPLFYLYIKSLTIKESIDAKDYFKRLAPFMIQLLIYTPMIAMPKDAFIDSVINFKYAWFYQTVGGIGLLFSAYYWWRCRAILKSQEEESAALLSEDRNLNYLNVVLTVYMVCLVIWAVLYIGGGAGFIFDFESLPLIEFLVDVMWFIIACVSFMMGYYAMNQPEILRVSELKSTHKIPEEEMISEVNIGSSEEPSEGLSKELLLIKDKLGEMMKSQFLFTNPRLTLPELAKALETNTHDLSKVINEGYNKNFYDFVNAYRVEAFIKEVLSDQRQELTYLGHAYNVGFNSKTAFNRAFKKETGQTPTQYFNQKKQLM